MEEYFMHYILYVKNEKIRVKQNIESSLILRRTIKITLERY